MNYRKLHNDELVDLIFAEEDHLSRNAANEIVRRADELIPQLNRIVSDKQLWTAELPEWWAPVHATYLLGQVGTEQVISPLLAALRWSDAYDNEWVAEDLPAIFGSIGKPAYRPLERIVADRSAGWSARGIAMDGLAAIALNVPELEDEIVRIIAAILDDPQEDTGARRAAAVILLDLKRLDCKEALMKFAAEEQKRFNGEPDFHGALVPKRIEKDLSVARRDTEFYARDWMSFYEPDEIKKRQRRWVEEDRRDHAGFEKGRHEIIESDKHAHPDDPCPCGSGKKYRHCCWEKLH